MMIAHFKTRFRERVAEWMCAGIILWSGLLFLSAPEVFNGAVYYPLRQIADQRVWGIGCALLGVARLSVLAINGLWLPSYRGRSIFAAISVMFWVQMTLGVLWSNPNSLGLAVFPVLLMGDTYAVYKAIVDFRLATAIREVSDAGSDRT